MTRDETHRAETLDMYLLLKCCSFLPEQTAAPFLPPLPNTCCLLTLSSSTSAQIQTVPEKLCRLAPSEAQEVALHLQLSRECCVPGLLAFPSSRTPTISFSRCILEMLSLPSPSFVRDPCGHLEPKQTEPWVVAASAHHVLTLATPG